MLTFTQLLLLKVILFCLFLFCRNSLILLAKRLAVQWVLSRNMISKFFLVYCCLSVVFTSDASTSASTSASITALISPWKRLRFKQKHKRIPFLCLCLCLPQAQAQGSKFVLFAWLQLCLRLCLRRQWKPGFIADDVTSLHLDVSLCYIQNECSRCSREVRHHFARSSSWFLFTAISSSLFVSESVLPGALRCLEIAEYPATFLHLVE